MLSSHKCSAKYQKNQGVFGLKCPLNIVEIGNILKKCFLRKSIGSLKSELITCAQKIRSRRSNCHASYCPVGNCHPNSCHLALGIVLPTRRRNNSYLDCCGCCYYYNQLNLVFSSLVLNALDALITTLYQRSARV